MLAKQRMFHYDGRWAYCLKCQLKMSYKQSGNHYKNNKSKHERIDLIQRLSGGAEILQRPEQNVIVEGDYAQQNEFVEQIKQDIPKDFNPLPLIKDEETKSQLDDIFTYLLMEKKTHQQDQLFASALSNCASTIERMTLNMFRVYDTQVELDAQGRISQKSFRLGKRQFCMFCEKVMELNPPKPCDCYLRVTHNNPCLLTQKLIVSPLNYKINPSYYEYQKEDLFDFIKLLALRKMKYTTHSSPFQLEYVEARFQANKKPLAIKCTKKQCDRYYSGQIYFPPVKLTWLNSQNALWGREANVEARQFIEKNTLLGEYAGQIVQKENAILIRKQDSIFSFGVNHYLGPVLSSNWCSIINTDIHPNVQAVLAIFGNKLGIFLAATKDIQPGESLSLDYGEGWSQGQTFLLEKLNS